jgi:hypothetical protein
MLLPGTAFVRNALATTLASSVCGPTAAWTGHSAYRCLNILVSIAIRNAHSDSMHGDAIDRMATYSFWALGLLVSAGIVVAVLVW